eukprot:m.348443 g.348443  ORF g.348443 m.348443 type:complete len:85 (+) comp16147_c0_seq42:5962-6216(+)
MCKFEVQLAEPCIEMASMCQHVWFTPAGMPFVDKVISILTRHSHIVNASFLRRGSARKGRCGMKLEVVTCDSLWYFSWYWIQPT